jgi:NodT family efflux transporter outer membrane factor (OMF) lipoprotein
MCALNKRKVMPKTLLLAALLAIELSAKDPPGRGTQDIRIPQAFDAQPESAGLTAQPAEEKWWRTLADPELDRLIESAVQKNLDLQLSTHRLLEARASRGISRADLLPSVGSSASVQRLRGGFQDGNVHVGTRAEPSSLISPLETNLFRPGLDASWELDLFGGKRKALQAATAEVHVLEESRRDVLVSLLGEVAINYAELRGAQRRLAITMKNVSLQRDSLRLTQVRADAGLGNRLDVERQQAQLESSHALAPALEIQISRTIHRLSVLMGEAPSALREELQFERPLPATPPEVPLGLPGDLLKRRPDLRRADAEITAALARVGAAKADLFPKILLTGTAGRQLSNIPEFTLGAGSFFSIGPAITLPLLSSGRIRANIEVRKQQLQEALTMYRRAVLGALQETEDSLVAYGQERERRARLRNAVKSSQTATELATERYTRGLADFLSVLDAQRDQLAAEDALAQSDTAVIANLVALYKALGGGWSETYPDR